MNARLTITVSRDQMMARTGDGGAFAFEFTRNPACGPCGLYDTGTGCRMRDALDLTHCTASCRRDSRMGVWREVPESR